MASIGSDLPRCQLVRCSRRSGYSSIPALAGADLNANTEGGSCSVLELAVSIFPILDNSNMLENAQELGVKNALCAAAWRGKSAVIELLLERGADASVKDTKVRSALEFAKIGEHESCINVLSRYARSPLEK